MKLLRLGAYGLVTIFGLALVAALVVYLLSERVRHERPAVQASRLATPTAAQLADARRQLRVLGCLSCHGKNLQGHLFFDEPGVAKLYAPNLTLVAAVATDAQLDQAIRQGVGHSGRALMVMPSQQYQFLTDAEAAALIAAIRAMPKGGSEQSASALGPLGRLGLALGKFKNASQLLGEYREKRLRDFGPEYARGRHIVETNCTECHGPQLKGKEVKPGTVSPDLQIAGAYDLPQFRALLRTGVAPGKKLDMMGEAARSDFRHLTDSEIADIHAYLVKNAGQ